VREKGEDQTHRDTSEWDIARTVRAFFEVRAWDSLIGWQSAVFDQSDPQPLGRFAARPACCRNLAGRGDRSVQLYDVAGGLDEASQLFKAVSLDRADALRRIETRGRLFAFVAFRLPR
jgi:hypothetical protein